MFNQWPRIVDDVNGAYKRKEAETGYGSLITIQKVRSLHQFIGHIRSLLALMAIHVKALEAYGDLIPPKHHRPQGNLGTGILQGNDRLQSTGAFQASGTIGQENLLEVAGTIKTTTTLEPQNAPHEGNRDDLASDLRAISTGLEYYHANLSLMVDLCKNLVELEFNIHGTRTNQNVEALTYLAFLFIPPSFLASVFWGEWHRGTKVVLDGQYTRGRHQCNCLYLGPAGDSVFGKSRTLCL
ncbi:hypothetical protein Z517_05692 [Fonsecaea pedrosoi CBS 271.37]|uniref:Uncharacterized protein n=1 Tax=Fonsecaea pedrosoi CBS 271.37 TaxID=1442368 RepID=A0A0D2GVM6_9EURO|nr:uncharacterized protein Z517_05692 [Fonsecaea pedrosoi CBS 271.37]KIW82665.1 hypothetical protein Z517_05692 [Fonsecaea pedrosoi CBS 271.37]